MSNDELSLEDDEPTMNLDDEDLIIDDDEPTMAIDQDEFEGGNSTEDLDLSDNEENYHGDGDDDAISPMAFQQQMANIQTVIVPSAGSFNALLIVSLVAYIGAAAIIVYRLAQYSAEGTFPW